MTPFEQGYYFFMKCAEDGMDPNTALMGAGALGVAGGLGTAEASRRLPVPTDAGRAALEDFMGVEIPGSSASTPRAGLERFLTDYTEKGHNLVGEKVVTPYGKPAETGRQFIETLRTGAIPDAIGAPVKWGPGTAQHYDAFAKSPQAALSELVRETGLEHANPAHTLSELPDDVLRETADHTMDKFKRYRTAMPGVRSFLDAQPNVQRGGRLAAGLGLGAMGLGAINKLRED
jgi:hypothetical protein